MQGQLAGERSGEALQFLKAIRFLLDDKNQNYRGLIESFYETLDLAIPTLIASRTFDDFIKKRTGRLPVIGELPYPPPERDEQPYTSMTWSLIDGLGMKEDDHLIYAVMKPDSHLVINKRGHEYLQGLDQELRRSLLTSADRENTPVN